MYWITFTPWRVFDFHPPLNYSEFLKLNDVAYIFMLLVKDILRQAQYPATACCSIFTEYLAQREKQIVLITIQNV
jgi:hypothetical protein